MQITVVFFILFQCYKQLKAIERCSRLVQGCLQTGSATDASKPLLSCELFAFSSALSTAIRKCFVRQLTKRPKHVFFSAPSSTPLFKYTFPPEKVKMLTTSVSSLSVENRFALFLFGRAFLITVRIALRESFARKALGTS